MAKTVTGGGKREQLGIQGEVEVESVVTAREAPPENQSTKNLIIIRNANGNKSYGKDNLFLEEERYYWVASGAIFQGYYPQNKAAGLQVKQAHIVGL